MMVSVRNPRKSNLTSPAASTSSLSNCVTGVVLPSSQYSGVEIRQHGRCNDHAAGMRAGVAHQPLEGTREIDQLAHIAVAVVQAPQFLLLRERLVERDADLERHQFRDLIDIAVVVAEHAPDVADHGLCRNVP